MSWSPDATKLMMGFNDRIVVYSVDNGVISESPMFKSKDMCQFICKTNPRITNDVITGFCYSSAYIRSTQDGSIVSELDLWTILMCDSICRVTCCTWSPDMTQLLVCYDKNNYQNSDVVMIDLASMKVTPVLVDSPMDVTTACCWSPDSKQFVVFGRQNKLKGVVHWLL